MRTISAREVPLVLRRRPERSSDDDSKGQSNDIAVQKLEDRLDALDRRLDNIDSMVTAVAERVMNRPLVVNVTCPHCGKNMEIALIGTEKPTR
ncbi:MAG: hypothetical protein A2Z74_03130 [Chloroflexi bacterium RBG_13_46_9]|nr:MAG: hypothetical protein A2Z74_03130 [Chloroflexi bacterium RBG_13_46_9]